MSVFELRTIPARAFLANFQIAPSLRIQEIVYRYQRHVRTNSLSSQARRPQVGLQKNVVDTLSSATRKVWQIVAWRIISASLAFRSGFIGGQVKASCSKPEQLLLTSWAKICATSAHQDATDRCVTAPARFIFAVVDREP